MIYKRTSLKLCVVLLGIMVGIVWNVVIAAPDKQKYVTSIRGHGVKQFSDNELFSFFAGNKEVNILPDSIRSGAFRILKVYSENGFPYTQIDSVVPKESDRGILLDIYISEGNPLRIHSVSFIGNHYYSSEQLHSFFKMKTGDLFNQMKLHQGIRRIEEEYHEIGYPFCSVEMVNSSGFSITDLKSSGFPLIIAVDEGREGRIDSVLFEGLNYTKISVLNRHINLPLKRRITKTQLDAAERSLNHLLFLERVSSPQWVLLPDNRTGILFNVQEGSPNSFSGILGYIPSNNQIRSGKGMVTGDLTVHLGNLFGTARSLTGRWARRDQTSQDFDFKYHEPWLFGGPLHLDLFFSQSIQDSSYLNRGAGIGTTFILSQTVTINATLEKNKTIPETYGQETYKLIRYDYYQGSVGFTYDTRDNPMNPRKGLYHSLGLRISRRQGDLQNGEEVKRETGIVFDRSIITDLEVAYPVTLRQVAFFRFQAAQMNSGGKDVPYSQWFTMGGAKSLRGYRELQFRSTSLGWWNVEYRFLPERLSRFFIFYDGGIYKNMHVAAAQWKQKYGYGMGFRINTGIGVIGVDYGMGEGDGPASGKVHVSLENRF